MTGPDRPDRPDRPDGPEAPDPHDPPTGPTAPMGADDPLGTPGDDPPGAPAGAVRAQEPPPPAPRRVTRSTSDRLLGGVSGGLGAAFGIDPVLFRIAFVVLTLVGGLGALAYLGAWLFIPADDARPGQSGTTRRVLVAAGAVVLVLASLPFLGPGALFGGALLPVALVGLLVAVLLRAARRDESDDIVRVLARITLAVLLVGAAVLAVLGVGAAAAFGGDVVMAALLVVAGVTLLVGAFVGGARWLIVPALIVALPLGVVAAADLDVEGGIGDRSYRPLGAAQLQPAYVLGMGQLVVDLRDLDLPAGRTNLELDVGLGEALVVIPDGVCVASDVQMGAGYVRVLDRDNGGLDVDWRDSPGSGSAPRLVIDAEVAMGALQVVRGDEYARGGPHDQPWDERSYSPGESAGNTDCATA